MRRSTARLRTDRRCNEQRRASSRLSGIPYLALLIGLVVQTLVTMAAYSVPVAAPAVAAVVVSIVAEVCRA